MILKMAFTVSGLVSREEMDVIQNREDDNKNNAPQYTEISGENSSKHEMELTESQFEIKNILGNNKLLKKDIYSFF